MLYEVITYVYGQIVHRLDVSTVRFDQMFDREHVVLLALLPHAYVDHTHADAVLSISNAPQGEERIREIYGERSYNFV